MSCVSMSLDTRRTRYWYQFNYRNFVILRCRAFSLVLVRHSFSLPHCCAGRVVKSLARSSYSSFPFSPVALPLLHRKKPITPISASPPMATPTPMPAFAPVERPPPEPPESTEAVADALSPVWDAAGAPLEDAEGVGALKSSLLTLKHGTWIVKSLVSTKVYQ